MKPYPKYKESGVEWLGEIPEHWDFKKLGYISRFQNGVSKGAEFFGSGFPFINYGDVYKNESLPPTASGLVNSSQNDRFVYSVKVGDILFTRTSETIEEIALSSVCEHEIPDAIFSGFLIRVRPQNETLNKKYSKYYFRAEFHRFYFVKEMNLVTRASLSQDLLHGLVTLLPPLPEQKTISSFLDRETQKIDLLIAKQEKLISLLEEKRQAMLFKAISDKKTQQLRLDHIAEFKARKIVRSAEYTYTPIGMFNRGRGFFLKELTTGDDLGDSEFHLIKNGDLIFSGQFAWEGAVGLVSEIEDGCIASHRYPIITGKEGVVNTAFLFAFFTSKFGDFLLDEHSRGSAGRNRPLNMNTLFKEKIPVPPLNLQAQIADLVIKERIMKRKVRKPIELLKEKRSALISAAVTGKIDVRELV